MQNRHESILRTVNNTGKKLNVLTFPTHERYESAFRHLDHVFYAWRGKGIKDWTHKYAVMPKNYILLDGSENQVSPDMKFDVVLSQNKYGQYQIARQVSDALNIPLVSLEHTLPMPWWTEKYIQKMTHMRGHINVFISEYSTEKWGYKVTDPDTYILHHGIDTKEFCPDENGHNDGKILSVCNDFVNRGPLLGFDIYKRVTEGLPINLLGDTPGLSRPAKNTKDLIDNYKKCSVFFNTSQVSPIPMSVLEAMSCGSPVVTTSTCMLPEIVKDGVNGFISNDERYLKEKLTWCLNNPDQAKQIGENARKTILEKFSIEQHINGWNTIFNSVFGKPFKYL